MRPRVGSSFKLVQETSQLSDQLFVVASKGKPSSLGLLPLSKRITLERVEGKAAEATAQDSDGDAELLESPHPSAPASGKVL